jgi:uncharacterized protein YjbI with pentapeptide repeats
MKRHYYILIAFLLVSLLVGILWKVPQWQAESQRNKINTEDLQRLEPKDRIQLEKDFAGIENNARTTLAQIIGGIVVLLGLYLTFQNVRVAQENARIAQKNVTVTEEGKITDRFSKAVELLGSEKLEIRLGGIYALERIGRDSQKDHWTVIEVLTAFVRENAKPAPALTRGQIVDREDTFDDKELEKPREDIQAIMTVIGRRKWITKEVQRLNMQGVNLTKCDLRSANLQGVILNEANLTQADLSHANLRRAHLKNAFLIKTRLYYADLRDSDLTGAKLGYAALSNANLNKARLVETSFVGAHLTEASLRGAQLFKVDLSNAFLSKADLTGAELYETDLDKTRFLSLDQLLSAKYGKSTKLPSNLIDQLNKWKEMQNKETENKIQQSD